MRSGLVSQPVEVLCRTLRGFEIPTVDIDHTGVTVTDHGPGLPPGDEDTVFERFRSRPGSPGHGLGLPLARWIARAHGGDLTATGAPADGTTFHLHLPTPR